MGGGGSNLSWLLSLMSCVDLIMRLNSSLLLSLLHFLDLIMIMQLVYLDTDATFPSRFSWLLDLMCVKVSG